MNYSEQVIEDREKYVPKAVSKITPCVAASAKNATVTDVDGNDWIDFTGGIAVNNVGHCHPKVVEAIREQADKLLHSSINVAMYESYIEVCKRLCQMTPGNFPKQAVLLNSGAEAVENAVKIARSATGRPGIICFENAFHGRTLLTMSLTSKVMPYKKGYGPFVPDVYRAEYPYCYRCSLGLKPESCGMACLGSVERILENHVDPEKVAAVIIEPVIGEGGFMVPPKDYMPKLKALCEKYGILFIADEIQSGFCRTGTLYAIEQWGVEPDILTTAKSLGGGMPLSAVVARTELMDASVAGGLGGTYGGNPVSCASALAVMDVVEEEHLCEKSITLGNVLRERLQGFSKLFSCIGDVRGLGAMMAFELVEDRASKTPSKSLTAKLVAYCHEQRLLLLTCGQYGNVVRLLMPLTITDEELERGLGILEKGLETL